MTAPLPGEEKGMNRLLAPGTGRYGPRLMLPLLLLWAAGASFAGELRNHTLREALARPVPRWSVLCAKLLALLTLSVATLLLTGLLSATLGGALFGFEGDWAPVVLGYLASFLSDLGLVCLGILVALLIRNVAGVVVGVTLFLLLDLGLRLALKLAGALGLETAAAVARWMPGEALAAWEGFQGEWVLSSFIGLGVLIAAALGLGLLRFYRLDVP